MNEVGIVMWRSAAVTFCRYCQKADHPLRVILDHPALIMSVVECQEQTVSMSAVGEIEYFQTMVECR